MIKALVPFQVPLNITVGARERVCTVGIEFWKFALNPLLKLEKLSVTLILAFFVRHAFLVAIFLRHL